MLDEGKKKFDGKRKRPNEGCIDSIKRSSYSFNKYNRCPKTSRIKNVYTRKKKKKDARKNPWNGGQAQRRRKWDGRWWVRRKRKRQRVDRGLSSRGDLAHLGLQEIKLRHCQWAGWDEGWTNRSSRLPRLIQSTNSAGLRRDTDPSRVNVPGRSLYQCKRADRRWK